MTKQDKPKDVLESIEGNTMGYEIEHKIVHHEWDKAIFPAGVFLNLFEAVFNDDTEDEENTLDTCFYTPTFRFEKGCMYGDEMWGVRDDRVWCSSGASGVMSWSEKDCQYVSHVYYKEAKLGDLVKVELKLDDALKQALSDIRVRAVEVSQ